MIDLFGALSRAGGGARGCWVVVEKWCGVVVEK